MLGIRGLQNSFGLSMILLSQVLFGGGYTVQNIRVGDYGTIMASSKDYIKNATVEKISFNSPGATEDQRIERNGFLVKYDDAIGTILICHGFMCDKFDTGFLRHLFPQGRYNFMTFDFRAHGEKRGGQYSTLGRDEAYDVIAAANFLKNHPDLKGKPLFVYGFSMGAVAAIEAQAKDSTLFTAMILDCPFDTAENVIGRGLDHLKFSIAGYTFNMPGRSILQKYAFHPYVQAVVKIVLKTVANMDARDIALRVFPFDPVKSVEKVSVPICLILCKKDERVSVDAIKEIFRNAGSSYKTLWLTNGRGHYDSYFYSPERYVDRIQSFLDLASSGTLQGLTKQEITEDDEDHISGMGSKERAA